MRQGRVLIVEDLAEWRDMLGLAVTRAGFSAATATSQEEALRHLAAEPFHILILDIRMEEGDPKNEEGMDLLRQLHDAGTSKVMIIIMLSAYGTSDQMREAFRDPELLTYPSC